MRLQISIILLVASLICFCTTVLPAQDYTDSVTIVEEPATGTYSKEETSDEPSTATSSGTNEYKREYMDEYELESLRKKREFQYRDLDSLEDTRDDLYFKEQDKNPKQLKGINANILLWLIIAVAVVVVVLQLAGVNMRQLFAPAKLPQRNPDEELSENIHDIPFEKAIQNAIQANNFSLATRLMYLQSLKLLSDRSLIYWHENKTNWHYVYELKGEKLRNSFRDITYIFEYVQYGHMSLSREKFEIVQETFRNFKSNVI